MTDLNIWQPSEDIAVDYITFKRIHEELGTVFSAKSKRTFGLYDVEHVFWFKRKDPSDIAKAEQKGAKGTPVEPAENAPTSSVINRLPESYVPPIVAILPEMARHDEALVKAAKYSGTSLERAFEKHIDAALTILGYETKLLGQGQGRVPDGRALAEDYHYAILWDGKVRAKSYSLSTDDRAIREYITTQSRELSRRHRNIYYVIISSSFADDFDDTIASIKMETDVSEVILLEAEALVAIVDAKMRRPLDITLGPDGIQRLFTIGGRISAATVREYLV
jgi:hypothetical protein